MGAGGGGGAGSVVSLDVWSWQDHKSPREMIFCKLTGLQTPGLESSCSGFSVGMAMTPRHPEGPAGVLYIFQSLPATFGRQCPSSREWVRVRGPSHACCNCI